jgi:hypothetical protein
VIGTYGQDGGSGGCAPQPAAEQPLSYAMGWNKGFRTGLLTGLLSCLGGIMAAALIVSFLF